MRLLAQGVAPIRHILPLLPEEIEQDLDHILGEGGRQQIGADAVAGQLPQLSQHHGKDLEIRPEMGSPVGHDMGLVNDHIAKVFLLSRFPQGLIQRLIFQQRLGRGENQPRFSASDLSQHLFRFPRACIAPIAENMLLKFLRHAAARLHILVGNQRHGGNHDHRQPMGHRRHHLCDQAFATACGQRHHQSGIFWKIHCRMNGDLLLDGAVLGKAAMTPQDAVPYGRGRALHPAVVQPVHLMHKIAVGEPFRKNVGGIGAAVCCNTQPILGSALPDDGLHRGRHGETAYEKDEIPEKQQ